MHGCCATDLARSHVPGTGACGQSGHPNTARGGRRLLFVPAGPMQRNSARVAAQHRAGAAPGHLAVCIDLPRGTQFKLRLHELSVGSHAHSMPMRPTRSERGYVSQFYDLLQFLDHQKIRYKTCMCAGKVELNFQLIRRNRCTGFSTSAYYPQSITDRTIVLSAHTGPWI